LVKAIFEKRDVRGFTNENLFGKNLKRAFEE
jgi:hypothetical protein